MATVEVNQGIRTAAEAELSELARRLAVLATAALDYPGALKQVAIGCLELSALARVCGKTRVHMTSRALATILDGLDRAPENDAPFILDTVAGFLESLHAACGWRGRAGGL